MAFTRENGNSSRGGFCQSRCEEGCKVEMRQEIDLEIDFIKEFILNYCMKLKYLHHRFQAVFSERVSLRECACIEDKKVELGVNQEELSCCPLHTCQAG